MKGNKKGRRMDDSSGVLKVTVISASGITEKNKPIDSFAKISCTFNKQVFKTRVKKKNANPGWPDHEHQFFIANPEGNIYVKLLNKDRWGREQTIGTATIPLDKVGSGDPIEATYDLIGKKSDKREVKVKVHFPIAKKGGEENAPSDAKKKLSDCYTLGDELGRGGFSVVRKGVRRDNGDVFAVKIIEKTAGEEELQLLYREIDIMRKLKHKNIISLEEVYDESDHIYLVMELVTGGELFDQIVSRGTYSEQDAAGIVTQILQAVEYMHSNGIAHRDLKPENLLVSGQQNDVIKVTDFGLSKDFAEATLKTSCGTPDYVAPEVLKGMPYDNSVDIWSIGVITYILLCGFPPFYGNSDQQIFEKIMKADYDFPSPDWDDISDAAKQFIGCILVLNYHQRPSATDCLSAPWLTDSCPARQLRSLESFRSDLTSYTEKRKKAR